jgi:hypothetical protein
MLLRRRTTGDAGIARITVVLMGALIAGLGIALTARTTVNNLSAANRDRVGTSALSVQRRGWPTAIGHNPVQGHPADLRCVHSRLERQQAGHPDVQHW